MALNYLNSKNIFFIDDNDTDEIIERVIETHFDTPLAFPAEDGSQLVIANMNGFDERFGNDESIQAAFRDACRYADLPSECVDVQACMNVFSDARNSGEISEEEWEEISGECEEQYWVEEHKSVELEGEQEKLLYEYIDTAWAGIRSAVFEKSSEPVHPFDPNTFDPPLSFEGDSCLLIWHDAEGGQPGHWVDDATGKVYFPR